MGVRSLGSHATSHEIILTPTTYPPLIMRTRLSQLAPRLRRLTSTTPHHMRAVTAMPLHPPSASTPMFFSTASTDKDENSSSASTTTTATSHQFEAETTQLLDIVINSLYTDKDVFLRELISNAADALEKLRYVQTAGEDGMKLNNPNDELKINIIINSESTPKTITIQDTGIGMSREQMIKNLGTIARSGSKAFLKENQGGAGDVDIIGRFGVGFYAAFMVASKISVTSKSADASVMGPAHVWTSEGLGSYDISESTAVVGAEDNDDAGTMRGTKIVLELREENDEFANDARLLQILKMYSNFVPFPIELSGERVNTVQAIWASTPSDVSEDQYNEFYRYVTNAFDDPMYKLHFRADVPLDLKALFYVSVLDNIVFKSILCVVGDQ